MTTTTKRCAHDGCEAKVVDHYIGHFTRAGRVSAKWCYTIDTAQATHCVEHAVAEVNRQNSLRQR